MGALADAQSVPHGDFPDFAPGIDGTLRRELYFFDVPAEGLKLVAQGPAHALKALRVVAAGVDMGPFDEQFAHGVVTGVDPVEVFFIRLHVRSLPRNHGFHELGNLADFLAGKDGLLHLVLRRA